ncbi:MAG: LytR C-terminal domain-containing protein [Candidatus Cloacimonetes bacterium]|nr:LytR C-terminal domain-containing protein [Candidatus Cloacimonadota bacterium]
MAHQNRHIWLYVLIVLILGIVSAGVYYLKNRKPEPEVQEQQLPAIKIKLLNGCGIPGIAASIRHKLMEQNIDVISVGNAEKFIYNKSMIVMKKKDEQDLARLIKMTGIQIHIEALNVESLAPFEIIIGKDFKQLINQ